MAVRCVGPFQFHRALGCFECDHGPSMVDATGCRSGTRGQM